MVARLSGPVLFARYAFGPERLGLCGPDDWQALLQLAAEGSVAHGAGRGGRLSREVDRGLRELARGFEGAFPYLELIARANDIEDPLDRRVVEAYWLGSPLSDRVDARAMNDSLATRFRSRMRHEGWAWLVGKPEDGARPTHAFHVLEVFPRIGLMRGGDAGDVMAILDACRIRWGTVIGVDGDRLIVRAVPLELRAGRLELGAPRAESVRRWLDGSDPLDDASVGDDISLHWGWACEVLTPAQLAALRSRTVRQLAIANQTL